MPFDCSKSLLYTIVIFDCNIFLWFCFCNIYFCLYTIVSSLLLQYISELSCTDGWLSLIYLFCLGSAGVCVCSAGVCSVGVCSAVLKWWCSDCIRVLSLFLFDLEVLNYFALLLGFLVISWSVKNVRIVSELMVTIYHYHFCRWWSGAVQVLKQGSAGAEAG